MMLHVVHFIIQVIQGRYLLMNHPRLFENIKQEDTNFQSPITGIQTVQDQL